MFSDTTIAGFPLKFTTEFNKVVRKMEKKKTHLCVFKSINVRRLVGVHGGGQQGANFLNHRRRQNLTLELQNATE